MSFRDRSDSTAFGYWRGNIVTDSRKIGQQPYVTSYTYGLADRIIRKSVATLGPIPPDARENKCEVNQTAKEVSA
jgi:hypothetical protein